MHAVAGFPAAGPTTAPAASAGRRNPHVRAGWLMAAILAGGVLLRVAPWFRANNFTGFLEYDDGV
ncbi:MAG: hypothetical protein JO259_17885, partial [Mycobacterium sp.]|nr:hypothetical protein [Mycobacterium sp.]